MSDSNLEQTTAPPNVVSTNDSARGFIIPTDKPSNIVLDTSEPSDAPTPAATPSVLLDDSILIEEVVTEKPVAINIDDKEQVVDKKQSKHLNNIKLEVDYRIENNSWDELADKFTLPSLHEDDLAENLQKSPNIKIGENQEDKKWADTIREGAITATYGDMLSEALERPDSDYKQFVPISGMNLAPAAPRFKTNENKSLKGEAAVIRMTSYLGLGSLFQIPLWHSGFWITFKPPTEASLVELQRILMNDKIQFGRYSYGRLYSGLTVYTVDRLVNFALEHIYDCSVKSSEISFSQLKEYIALEDIFPLLWGFMATVYPKGFQYERACATDPEKCRHVVQEKLNLARLLWTDNSSLSEWQKIHMSSRSSQTKDKESILKYRQELLRLTDHRVKINDDPEREVFVTFQIGFIKDYIEASYKWIQEIVSTVESAASLDQSAEEKENFIVTHGKSSTLRQSTHQVKSIEFDSNIIEDRETIEKTLAVFSSDETLVKNFFNYLNKFNNNSTISVVGIPTYNCPKCGSEQKSNLEKANFVNIIPLDVIQLFFDLITQRIQKINIR
jgi:hypothetical protein